MGQTAKLSCKIANKIIAPATHKNTRNPSQDWMGFLCFSDFTLGTRWLDLL
ncbi:hypothetical protein PAECIP111891_03595 [Paenibacillus allorhizoplanae]|uniref:Transposase n=1 Tax=Paenibacillus allorhizoplanae TaxID=2905648 RepID=A0ABM9CDF0_9BACL|nr:hypothetical protein PAECIP111891_03595 [Paenibacillus allorhizoplanae]